MRINVFLCGEFYSLGFNNLLRVNVFTCKEFYCPLFSNLDEAIFLIALVITAVKNLINNSKTERFFPQDLLSVDIVLVHPYFVQAYTFRRTLALQLLGLPGSPTQLPTLWTPRVYLWLQAEQHGSSHSFMDVMYFFINDTVWTYCLFSENEFWVTRCLSDSHSITRECWNNYICMLRSLHVYIHTLRNQCLSSRCQEKMKQTQQSHLISENTKETMGNSKEYL